MTAAQPTPRDEIRVVLVGLGVRGRQWKRVILGHDQATLVAAVEVADKTMEGSEIPVYTSLEESLQSTPDAVIIASPPATHRDVIATALEHGLPVLCEKPLSESLEEAIEITEQAEEKEIPLLVGMNFRFTDSALRLRELVLADEYGRPIIGSFIYIRNRDGRRPDLNDYPLEMDQPMLVEQSIHHLDLMRFVYAREVEHVLACTWNPATSVYAGDSCVAAILTFPDNLVVNYLGTWTSGSARLEFSWRTDFEKGFALQDDQFGELTAGSLDEFASAHGPLFDETGESTVVLAERAQTPFIDETSRLLDHLCAVVTGREEAHISARDHLNTLGLLDAIRTSSETGSSVELSAHLRSLGIPARSTDPLGPNSY